MSGTPSTTSLPPWLELRRGDAPLVLSIPHTGTDLAGLEPKLVSAWLARKDADWWIERLYDFAVGLDATILRTTVSRTVIDVNRDPSGVSLYPGQATTGLCPDLTFDGTPVYADGQAVGAEEVAQRRETWWRPYHEQLRREYDRLRAVHGVAMLWDAHSIRSVLPRFFEGKLPDLNVGTAKGASCAPQLGQRIHEIAQAVPGHTSVLNGRYTGGYITRRYGDPTAGFHAVQLEMTWCSYMQEQWPFEYLPQRADAIQPHLRRMLEAMLAFARERR
jgi:N-formylglutamate deformylase